MVKFLMLWGEALLILLWILAMMAGGLAAVAGITYLFSSGHWVVASIVVLLGISFFMALGETEVDEYD